MEQGLTPARKEKKARKPAFLMQGSWKIKRLPRKWRRPKGLHSKMRLKKKGNPKLPSQGYRSPAKLRGADQSGLKTSLIHSAPQLSRFTADAGIIASSVGTRKKLEILKLAAEKKIKIANLPQDFASRAEAAFEERKKKKTKPATPEKKQEKKEETKKGKTPAKESEEDKRNEAKKDMEKIITKRS